VEAWRTPLPIDVLLASKQSPVSVVKKEGVVYAATSGFVFALAESDGRVLWKNELPRLGFNEISLALDGTAMRTVREVVYRPDPGVHHHRHQFPQ
jgi:hypothetical protein